MIALDSSTIICLVEHHQPAARTIAAEVLVDADRIVCSVLAATECLVGPLKSGERTIYLLALPSFFDQPQVQLRDVTAEIAERAAVLRVEFGLKAIDAVHLATALECRADTFVSTDQKGFARCAGHLPLNVLTIARSPD